MVSRIIVDKGFCYNCRDARRIFNHLRNVLLVEQLDDVRIFHRYDVEGLTDDEFANICDNTDIFHDADEEFFFDHSDIPKSFCTFVMQEPAGQFDARADNAAQAIALVTGNERPAVRCAMVVSVIFKNERRFDYDFFFDNVLSYDAFDFLRNKICEMFSMEIGSEDLPDFLRDPHFTPDAVPTLHSFTTRNPAELEEFRRDHAFAMTADDMAFCQHYFRDTARRSPTLAELKLVDTYWSDHCRHTTFNAIIDGVVFEGGKYQTEFESAFAEYIIDKLKVDAAKKVNAARLAAERAEELISKHR